MYPEQSKPMEVRLSNMTAAKAISDAVRTSLGPKGMDKMVRVYFGGKRQCALPVF
jgi:T-complex protein 1 subunit delta